MADQWNSDRDRDEAVTGGSDEQIRSVADEADEFEDTDEVDQEEDEEGSTF